MEFNKTYFLLGRSDADDTGDLTCISLDTSYAVDVLGVDVVHVPPLPNQPAITTRRGLAVSELLLYRKDQDDTLSLAHPRYEAVVHGVLADGRLYEAHPDDSEMGIAAGDHVGHCWYVKGRCVEDGRLVLARKIPPSKARRWGAIENKYVSVSPVESISDLREKLAMYS